MPQKIRKTFEKEKVFVEKKEDSLIDPESKEQPNALLEKAMESGVEGLDAEGETKKKTEKSGEAAARPVNLYQKTKLDPFDQERVEKIDEILSEGLADIFLQMNSKQQKAFKEKGEETALKINILLKEAKVKVKKIINLIKDWFKMIPGVNRYFLEQESKIKTDKIIKLKK